MIKETIGDAILYHGDCLELLPVSSCLVDLIMTDPPYGIGADSARPTQQRNQHGWRDFGEASGWDNQRAVKAIEHLVAMKVPTCIWGGNYYTDVLPPSQGWLIWDKGQDGFSLADAELAWTSMDRATRRLVFHRSRAVKLGGFHPTQKPTRVMEWAIDKFEGDIVFDPFMGSGSTGVACANLGRKFIGVEVNRRYFDIACERIGAAQAQGRLFA